MTSEPDATPQNLLRAGRQSVEGCWYEEQRTGPRSSPPERRTGAVIGVIGLVSVLWPIGARAARTGS